MSDELIVMIEDPADDCLGEKAKHDILETNMNKMVYFHLNLSNKENQFYARNAILMGDLYWSSLSNIWKTQSEGGGLSSEKKSLKP